MKCSKCGQENEIGTSYCVACGNNLAPDAVVEETKNPVAEAIAAKPTAGTKAGKINFMDYLKMILVGITKPHKYLTEEVNKLSGIKDSAMMAAMIGVITTVISLIKSMFGAVHHKNIFTNETQWMFENLKNVNYLKIIGLGLLITVGASFVIAGIYYIVGLILKKESNYSKMVAIAAVSLVPVFASMYVLSPLLGLIHYTLSMIISVAGVMFTLVMLYEGINQELKLEGDVKLYVNIACLSIIGVAAYYIGVNILFSSITDSLSSSLSGLSSLFQ